MTGGLYDIAPDAPKAAPLPEALRQGAERFRAAVHAEADRWPLWVPVCLAAGIAAYLLLRREPADALVLVALGLATLIAIAAARGHGRPATLFLAALLFGFVIAKARTEAVRAPVLPATTGMVTLTGIVEAFSPQSRGMARLTLRIEAIEGVREAAWPARARVTARRPDGDLGVGDRVTLRTRLFPPGGPVEPGGYDPARRLWFEGIGATGFTLSRPLRDDAAPPGWSPGRAVADIRAAIGRRIAEALPPVQAAIATALIIGERGGIPGRVSEALRASGLFHILAISGLHLTLVAGAVFWALRAGLALSPTLALARPIKKWAAAGALLAAFGYLAISGAHVATQRAAIMLSVMCLAVMLDRPALSMRNVMLAALVILCLTPEVVLSASFQMSFLAVMGLIAAFELHTEWRRRRPPAGGRRTLVSSVVRTVVMFLAATAATTLVASLFTALPAAFHFNRVSSYSLLANVLALPVVSLIVMPSGLAAVLLMPLGLEGPPLQVMAAGIDATLAVASRVAALPGSAHVTPSMPLIAALVASLGAIWLCLWRGRLRLAGVPLLLAGLAAWPSGERPDLLVEASARNVAVRNAEGKLVPASGRRARYAVERWLLKDGDALGPAAAAGRPAWTCAEKVCRASMGGLGVVYLSEGAAVEAACAQADVLIAEFPLRGRCARVPTRIDRFDVWRSGAYALWVGEGGRPRLETAARLRGQRPWTPQPVARRTILDASEEERAAGPPDQE